MALWGLVQDIVTALYTRLCFLLMVESPPPRLLHSWNHPFHNFHCRNDTIEVYLDLFNVTNVDYFCKLNILHQHLPGMPDTKDCVEVVLFTWVNLFMAVQNNWCRYRKPCLSLPCSCIGRGFYIWTEISALHSHFTMISYQIYGNVRLFS